MSLLPSKFPVLLAVAAGALSFCVISPSAQAGDKIEFSAPSTLLEVPRVEREDKGSPNSELRPPLPADAALPQEYVPVSPEIVIISASKRNDAKTQDSSYPDIRDTQTRENSIDDSLDSQSRSISSAKRQRDLSAEGNLDASGAFSDKKTDQPATPGSLRARMETFDRAGKGEYQKDDRYYSTSSDSTEDSGSRSRSYFHYGASGLQRTTDGQFMPFTEEMRAMNEQATQRYLSARPSNPANDPLRDPASPASTTAYSPSRDFSRDRTPDEAMSAPQTFHPAEARPVNQNTDTFSRQEPPPSPRGQVQSRPAILPFPKKPGDVLR
jgi:hypothetical protein